MCSIVKEDVSSSSLGLLSILSIASYFFNTLVGLLITLLDGDYDMRQTETEHLIKVITTNKFDGFKNSNTNSYEYIFVFVFICFYSQCFVST